MKELGDPVTSTSPAWDEPDHPGLHVHPRKSGLFRVEDATNGAFRASRLLGAIGKETGQNNKPPFPPIPLQFGAIHPVWGRSFEGPVKRPRRWIASGRGNATGRGSGALRKCTSNPGPKGSRINLDTTHGTAIYADQLGWFQGSIDRHICHTWSVWVTDHPPRMTRFVDFHCTTIG